MHFPKLLAAAAAVLPLTLDGIPVEAENKVVISGYSAPSYQAASDLYNVSTYHALTRVKGSISQQFKESFRRGHFGQYGVSPTTSYDMVRSRANHNIHQALTTSIYRVKHSIPRLNSVTILSTSWWTRALVIRGHLQTARNASTKLLESSFLGLFVNSVHCGIPTVVLPSQMRTSIFPMVVIMLTKERSVRLT